MNTTLQLRATGPKPPLLVLIGPTAIGKTKLSIEIAKQYNCEIISGDSMQVYRGMDIGTAKITPEETEGIPHHMIDIADPSDPFSVADFQQMVRELIPQIEARGKTPFIVGGTGLYIESLCYDYKFSEAGSDEIFREEQRRFMEEHGEEALHNKLKLVDPQTAEKLHPRDTRRVIRALEVAHVTGRTLSEQLAEQTRESPYSLLIVGLTTDRQILYKRIEERIDKMLAAGLIDEVKQLLDQGVPRSCTSMQGLGYKEIAAYLEGELKAEEAEYLLKRNTRRFAKRQLSWFRHMKEIEWLDIPPNPDISLILQSFHQLVAGKFILDTEYNGQ